MRVRTRAFQVSMFHNHCFCWTYVTVFAALQDKILFDWLNSWKDGEGTHLLVSAMIGADGTVVLEDVLHIGSAAPPGEKALNMAA